MWHTSGEAYIRGPGQQCEDQGGTQLKGPLITCMPLARLKFEDLADPQPRLLEIPNGQFPAVHARPPNPATALDGWTLLSEYLGQTLVE